MTPPFHGWKTNPSLSGENLLQISNANLQIMIPAPPLPILAAVVVASFPPPSLNLFTDQLSSLYTQTPKENPQNDFSLFLRHPI
jgi:hypothetical protein